MPHIVLDAETERLLQEQLVTGRFSDASQVVRAGLELLASASEAREQHLAELAAALKVGLEDVATGRVNPPSAVRDRLREALS